MAIVLNNVTSGYNISTINSNFQKIEDYVNDKLLARAATGVAGEAMMSRSLDMNGNEILNYPIDVTNPNSLVTKSYVDNADLNLQSQINKTLRFNDNIPMAAYGSLARANSLQGYDSNGAPVPIFSMTATADLAVKLASHTTGLGSSLVGMEGQGTVKDAIDWKTVDMFGAVGDGTTNDAAAIQAGLDWLKAANHRELRFNSEKSYRISSALSVDFGGSILGSRIVMNGFLVPDTSVGDALTIQNAWYGDFLLKVKGAGVSVPSSLPDYNQADPSGAKQAFVINSCRGCKISVLGRSYPGRVLRTKSTSTVKLSFLNIDIRTSDVDSPCGQGMYLQGADSAFGVISSAQNQWDSYGSVLDSLTDITIVYWECSAATPGFNPAVTLKSLVTAHIDVLAVGQGAGTATAVYVEGGTAITVNKLFTTQCSTGLHIKGGTAGSSELNRQIFIASHNSYGSNVQALKLEGTTNIKIADYHYDSVGLYGIYFTGLIRGVELSGYIRNPTTHCLYGDATANLHRVFIGGRLYSASNITLVNFLNATLQYILFKDVTALTTGGVTLSIPSVNSITLDGGTWETTGATLWNNRPGVIVNTYRPLVESRGSSNFPSGSANGATVTINHGLGVDPTDIDLRWIQIPTAGAELILTATTSTTFTVTLSALTALSTQVNFRWFANANLV